MSLKQRKKYWWRIDTYICKKCKLKLLLKAKLTRPEMAGKFAHIIKEEDCPQCYNQKYFTALIEDPVSVLVTDISIFRKTESS